jgi:RNA polymerase sigma factor (sigma-70 family)
VSAVKEAVSARETFAELYEEHMDKVFRYIQYRVSNIQLAEDLTSSVFEKALVNFSKYSSDKASFSTWLFSIARNTLIDYYRVKGKRQAASLEEGTDIASKDLSPEQELERKEKLERLQVCLAELPQEEQKIIRFKFGAELNNRQIAEMLGLSETSVGTRLYRAVRKLRDSFQGSKNG